MRAITTMVLTAALLAGCATSRSTVPVIAAPGDLSTLAGEWEGEYTGAEGSRTGFISFALAAGRDTAEGEVVMLPPGLDPALVMPERMVATAPEPRRAEVLTIRFVSIADGRIVGELGPYRDPQCGCALQTRFSGTLMDDGTIEGTFVTTGGIHHPLGSGRWKVERVKR
jgi:hypothetical protein